jgi:hypothetical protein
MAERLGGRYWLRLRLILRLRFGRRLRLRFVVLLGLGLILELLFVLSFKHSLKVDMVLLLKSLSVGLRLEMRLIIAGLELLLGMDGSGRCERWGRRVLSLSLSNWSICIVVDLDGFFASSIIWSRSRELRICIIIHLGFLRERVIRSRMYEREGDMSNLMVLVSRVGRLRIFGTVRH